MRQVGIAAEIRAGCMCYSTPEENNKHRKKGLCRGTFLEDNHGLSYPGVDSGLEIIHIADKRRFDLFHYFHYSLGRQKGVLLR